MILEHFVRTNSLSLFVCVCANSTHPRFGDFVYEILKDVAQIAIAHGIVKHRQNKIKITGA